MAFKTILIIEDDLSIGSGLQLLFEGEGYHVLLARHGQEALDLFKKSSVLSKLGLILLDFMMPVMDGATFLLELQKNHPEILETIPIFIITAGIPTIRVPIKTTGFLQKPFDMDELFGVVAKYCGHNILPIIP